MSGSNARTKIRAEPKQAGGASLYSLAAGLIPKRGVKAIQSDKIRGYSRRAFPGARLR